MAIHFDLPEAVKAQIAEAQFVAETLMRPFAREMDENEHTLPRAFIDHMWPIMRDQQAARLANLEGSGQSASAHVNLALMLVIETWSWGDAGIYLCLPAARLAGAAIEAVGTREQKLRLLTRFARGDTPLWGAMAMTEPGAGSDTSAIQTSAVYDETMQEWVLNGEKIFCTNGRLALETSNGLVVVWAMVSRTAGRAGMKPFVVESGTRGVSVSKVEIKHGIRASNTAAIVLNNVRVPAGNLLGSADVQTDSSLKGFKGAMATFDATRPRVAASALGVGRAALEFVKEKLREQGVEIVYGAPYHKLSAIQRDVLEMEAQLKAAYLLTLRAAVMLDQGLHNSLEASMAKVKAGKAVTWITQKAVELLGPLGYSREWLVEKWMRDGKINDIYEGTGQINTLIVARRILGYSRKELS
jgi:acyl-CoA dehydrogenase